MPEKPISTPQQTQIYILPSGKTTVQGLDLLFFGGDTLRKLDTWQHFDDLSGNHVTGVSSSRAETFAAIGNYPCGAESWSGLRTYASLSEIRFRLEDEQPSAPLLWGTGTAGSPGTLLLRPMLSRIMLRSIACDFSERPYAGERLQDVRAYLTWASRECRPFDPDDRPVSWLNAGRLDEVETASLSCPETVLQTVSASLGSRIRPEADFYCYPNPVDGETFGSPVTRLVIEGKLKGTTYYYPIDLPHLEADTQYRLDITLTRAGTTDPDTPAVSGSILLEGLVLDWDGRELEDIHYQ